MREDSQPSSPIFRFSQFEVDVAAGEIRKLGMRIRLQEKPFQVLALLLGRHGDVVTREDLRQCLWPADTFVDFDAGLNTALNKVRSALGDSAENPTFIETIPRQGYRFIAPVISENRLDQKVNSHDFEAAREGTAQAIPKKSDTPARSANLRATTALVALAAVAVFAPPFGHPAPPPAPSASPRVKVLVLPLDVLSAEPGVENFGMGLTDEIIAQVGRTAPERLGVISRATSSWCKKSQKPVDQLAREIGVDSVLEGSVQYANGDMRVTTQLFAGKDQASLWTGTYESQVHIPTLAVERDIASNIAAAIANRLLPNVLSDPFRNVPAPQSAQGWSSH